MEEGTGSQGRARRDEDIALDLMKFIAMTTGYGRTTSSGVGFQGTGSTAKPEEYAAHLLELYGRTSNSRFQSFKLRVSSDGQIKNRGPKAAVKTISRLRPASF